VPDSKPTKATKLRALQMRFIEELPSRLTDIEREWQSGHETSASSVFYRLVHSLAGSAGTFGFPRLGTRARELELLLQQGNNTSAEAATDTVIIQALSELQLIAADGPDKVMPAEPLLAAEVETDEAKPSLIYTLEDDIHLAEETAQQLQHFGYRVEAFHSVDALKAGVERQVPDALLADINLPEGTVAGTRVAAELRGDAAQDMVVIFISGQESWQDRLNAVRAGGHAFLSKPINFSLLMEQLDAVLGNSQESPYRILIVEDTPLLAEHYANVIQTAGMQTEVLHDPAKLLDVVPVFGPDLILMDIFMPGCTGVEAAQVIRQHSAYTNLPIVYLSTEKSLTHQLEALRAGGDDFLQKPISDTHLVSAVSIRARRFRELTALMVRDGLTGLLNHINLKLALEREISQAQRRSSSLCFVMIDIDFFKSVNDTYGHPVGDQVIKSLARLLSQRLRTGDIAARYGGEEFALVLPDTRVEDARVVIDDLRQQFAQITYAHESGAFNATFSAGIASFPPHGEMEALIAAADGALYQAKHGGRNQLAMDDGKSDLPLTN